MQVCYCRDGSRVADSTKHLILQGRRAESLFLEYSKRKLDNFELIGGGMREYHQHPHSQMAEKTNTYY